MKHITPSNVPTPTESGNHGGASGAAFSSTTEQVNSVVIREEGLPEPATGQADSGAHFMSPRYAVGLGDPMTPVSDGAKVKMKLSRMTNPVMVPYIENHIGMMTGNPLFATPLPAAADFLAQFNAYHDAVLAAEAAETAWKNAVAIRDGQRVLMVAMMIQRGAYVQVASNGNRQAILSSGLGVKNTPTPVTFLAAPTNLRVDLNGEAGLVKIRWEAVPHARNYVLQCSPDVPERTWTQIASTGKRMVRMNLEIGQTYVFRVAAQGKPGQSNWSAECIRGVA